MKGFRESILSSNSVKSNLRTIYYLWMIALWGMLSDLLVYLDECNMSLEIVKEDREVAISGNRQ
jgi:hypothetical protein